MQKTTINNTFSNELHVPYGVPQGSILGPTLFTVYIKDLVEWVRGNVNFYADDTIIYNSDLTVLMADLARTYPQIPNEKLPFQKSYQNNLQQSCIPMVTFISHS